MLIAGMLVLTACAGGPPDAASAPSDGTIPAQGPCDEPLLDGDVVAAAATGGVALIAAELVLADGPLYESVESLVSSSDLVVRGTVGPTVGSASGAGSPGAIREIEVLEVLAGEAPSELRVSFGLGDTAGERCAPVVEGRQVVLFLAASVADTDATHFVIGSHNNGVMTVDEGQALVHSWVPGRLRESDPPRDDLPEDGGFPPPGLAFDLDDIRDVADTD
jgi:hypothetical protein